jgi:uncharacterized protein YndB with AHSA1/START domain
MTTKTTPSNDLVLTRVFDAPRDLVWRAFSDPEHFMRWWGPSGFTAPHCTMNFRIGGAYLWCMRAEQGHEYWTRGEFTEISPMDRIAFTHGFADPDGNAVPPSYYGIPVDTLMITTVTVVFENHENGGTQMTLIHKDAAGYDGVEEGWGQAFDKLASSLDKPFVVTRTFDAPRELVWKAFTEPERMAKWWGPPGTSVGKYSMDLRSGGRYHFSLVLPDGGAMWGLFVYQEVSPFDRIVYHHSFSDEGGNIGPTPFGGPWPARLHTTLSFADRDGKTEFTLQQFPIDATRDEEAAFSALFDGMNQGWAGTLDRLVEYLAGGRP